MFFTYFFEALLRYLVDSNLVAMEDSVVDTTAAKVDNLVLQYSKIY